MKILTMHKHDKEHLEEVKAIAKKKGSVQIKAYYDGETIYCLEGVHRVQAAYELQLPVIVESIDYDSTIETDQDGEMEVSELFDRAYGTAYGPQGNIYNDDDFVSVEVI